MEFDYVVVGAGAAGCALATRLAQRLDADIALLETGPAADDPRIWQPVAWPQLCGSELDHRYLTVPQAELGGRRLAWPRGRVVGGSAAINALVWVRGHVSDYAAWERLAGPGWGPDAVLGTLDRLESTPAPAGVPLERVDPLHPFCAAFLEAAQEVGHKRLDEFTPWTMTGVGAYPLTRRAGHRWNTSLALQEHGGPGRVTVLTDARTVELELAAGRTTGVRLHDGRRLGARRDVVLTAGAVETPALLLRSGIGPAAHLEAVGVEVRHDLPGIGAGLHDHVQVSLAFPAHEPVPVAATSNLGEAGGFVATRDGLPAPDVQLSFAPMLGLNDPASQGSGFTIGPAVTRPAARGSLRLASADPDVPPLVDPAYLSDPHDLRTLVDGVEVALEIATAGPLRALARDVDTSHLRTRTGREEFVRANAQTQYHPVGSVAAGTSADAPLDERWRVRGIDGLRVADASAIPVMTTGNIHAPVLAVALLAADDLCEVHDA